MAKVIEKEWLNITEDNILMGFTNEGQIGLLSDMETEYILDIPEGVVAIAEGAFIGGSAKYTSDGLVKGVDIPNVVKVIIPESVNCSANSVGGLYDTKRDIIFNDDDTERFNIDDLENKISFVIFPSTFTGFSNLKEVQVKGDKYVLFESCSVNSDVEIIGEHILREDLC